MDKSLVITGIILAAAIILGILFNSSSISNAEGLSLSAFSNMGIINYQITTSQGLTLGEVLDAFLSPAVRDEKGTQNILLFTKSGGFLEQGNKQPNLRVDLPVKVTEQGDDVSFQYFVEIKDDLTPEFSHCTDVRLHVYLDNKKVYTTGWMGYEDRNPALALQTDTITIHDVPVGKHDVGLVPEGRIGGCNVEGYIFSWGGTAVVYQ